MSHFTVLCMGNVDYNLAPFHEFESTGCDDEFVQTLNITEEKKKNYNKAKESYKEKLAEYEQACQNALNDEEKAAAKVKFENDTQYSFKKDTFREYLENYCVIPIIGQNEKIDLENKCKYGYAVEIGEDCFEVYERTNPNAIWDYYSEGGRYEGMLLLKQKDKKGNDVFTNQALKSEIDFEEMWKRDEEKARTRYRKVIKILGKIPVIPHTWKSLVASCRNENDIFTREEANKIYEAQEDYILWKSKSNELKEIVGWGVNVEDYACTEDQYIINNTIHAITYGIIKNRKYYSKGDMGWWACSTNEKEPSSWDEEYKQLIEECDDDTYITVVDCHI